MSEARANSSLLPDNKMVLEFGTSGTAVCAATFATNPIDVVKVRVQLSNSTGVAPGLVGTASSILRNEGAAPRPDGTHEFQNPRSSVEILLNAASSVAELRAA